MANNTTCQEQLPIKGLDVDVLVYLALYSLIIIMSVGGNLLIILAIANNPRLRHTIFILLLCLAVSDFLFALLSPLHVRAKMYPGIWDLKDLGDLGCQIYYYLFRGLYAFSVITMVVIAVDRYLIMRRKTNGKHQPAVGKVIIFSVYKVVSPVNLNHHYS